MNRNTLSALLGLALAAAPAAQAAESPLSYTYVEGRLINAQSDAVGSTVTVNGNGGGLNGSVAFGNTGLFATASFDRAEVDDRGGFLSRVGDIRTDRAALGLGYAWAIDESLHLVLDAKALRLKLSDDTGSISEDGYQATVGLRSLLSDDLEGTIKAGVIKVDDDVLFYDGAIVELGARWHLNAAWSVGLDGAFTKDERNGALSLRLQW